MQNLTNMNIMLLLMIGLMNVPKKSQNVSFATCWTTNGTFMSVKDITTYSKNPNQDYVVFHSSPKEIQTKHLKHLRCEVFDPWRCSKSLRISVSKGNLVQCIIIHDQTKWTIIFLKNENMCTIKGPWMSNEPTHHLNVKEHKPLIMS